MANLIGGTISGGLGGIFANGTVDITANAGIIEATGGIGEAINASDTAKVNNASTGTIRSNALNTIDARRQRHERRHDRSHGREQPAIFGSNAIVNNVSGGTISGVGSGIRPARPT